MPRSFARVITLITMAMAGAMVKTAAVTAIFFSLSFPMPMAMPRRQALTRKNTDWPSTARTMTPTRTKRVGWLTSNMTASPPFGC